MTDAHTEKLLEFRMTIEAFGARCAAMRIAENPALMDGFDDILKRLAKAARSSDYPKFREADQQLHEAILGIADVPGLLDTWQFLWEKLRSYHNRSWYTGVHDQRIFIDEHEYLVEMLRMGDPAVAEEVTHAILEAVRLRMRNLSQAPKGSTGRDLLHLASAHLAAYLQYPLRLEEVAAKVAFTSSGNLSRLFRRHHGMGFKAYLKKLRMEKAAKLLAGTEMPIFAIARRAGYRSMPLFAEHFSQHHDMLPREWRKEKNPNAHPPRKKKQKGKRPARRGAPRAKEK